MQDPIAERMTAAALLAQMEHMAGSWRRTAARLQRYSEPAAESFRQAAEDLDRLRARHGEAMDAMRALREYLAGRGEA